MSSIIFGPFSLLGNAHLFNWLLWWPVGIDTWCRSCIPEVRIRQRVGLREKIRRISNLLKTFEVRTLSNSNANFVTSLVVIDLIFIAAHVVIVLMVLDIVSPSQMYHNENCNFFSYTLYTVDLTCIPVHIHHNNMVVVVNFRSPVEISYSTHVDDSQDDADRVLPHPASLYGPSREVVINDQPDDTDDQDFRADGGLLSNYNVFVGIPDLKLGQAHGINAIH